MDYAGLTHEIVSVVIGGMVSIIGHKALELAKDVNSVWSRLRALESDVSELKLHAKKTECGDR